MDHECTMGNPWLRTELDKNRYMESSAIDLSALRSQSSEDFLSSNTSDGGKCQPIYKTVAGNGDVCKPQNVHCSTDSLGIEAFSSQFSVTTQQKDNKVETNIGIKQHTEEIKVNHSCLGGSQEESVIEKTKKNSVTTPGYQNESKQKPKYVVKKENEHSKQLETYMGLALIVMIFFNLPCGIVAVVLSKKSSELLSRDEISSAKSWANGSLFLSITGVAITNISIVICLITWL